MTKKQEGREMSAGDEAASAAIQVMEQRARSIDAEVFVRYGRCA